MKHILHTGTVVGAVLSMTLFTPHTMAWDDHTYTPDWLNTIESNGTRDSSKVACDSGVGDNEDSVIYCVQPGPKKFETNCELDGKVGDTEGWICPPQASTSLGKTQPVAVQSAT